jgi:hypothetical protein
MLGHKLTQPSIKINRFRPFSKFQPYIGKKRKVVAEKVLRL